jgi:hypothetical protein
MKTACLFVQLTPHDGGINSNRYNKLTECAINSFKKFHPDIPIHYINDDNFQEYYSNWEHYEMYDSIGLVKCIAGYELMVKNKLDKLIILGSDTITCGRLDEFILNDDDVLATLNYPMPDKTEFWETPFYKLITPNGEEVYDCAGLNADVICFNNPEALKRIIDLTINYFTHFHEQGGLNHLAWSDGLFKVNTVDGPYPLSKVSYNVRSKGVNGAEMIKDGKLVKHGPQLDGTPSPTLSFYTKDNKLFTQDHKQIKVFHYCEGLGCQNEQVFIDKVNDFHTWFNQETKDFFTNECDCGDFFIKQFEI